MRVWDGGLNTTGSYPISRVLHHSGLALLERRRDPKSLGVLRDSRPEELQRTLADFLRIEGQETLWCPCGGQKVEVAAIIDLVDVISDTWLIVGRNARH
jgi:hypothetical protein